jgi:hypothetical protein
MLRLVQQNFNLFSGAPFGRRAGVSAQGARLSAHAFAGDAGPHRG